MASTSNKGGTGKSSAKSTSSKSTAKTVGKSSAKANANRVIKAAKKVDTSKSFKDNQDALKGVIAATATSAVRASNKKQRKFYTILAIVMIVAFVGVTFYGYCNGWFDAIITKQYDINSNTYSVEAIANENLSVHFLELGNKHTGDCVYIKAGNNDILIDAGSKTTSIKTIEEYVDRFCTDNKLEYVIATHAHEDHIAGFTSTGVAKGIFEYYECDTLIQFAKTDSTTKLYGNYCKSRDENVKHVYTALQCYNETDGAERTYDISGDGSVTLEILYQKYYEEKASTENNYSVCCIIHQGENNYLFTGDLESDGEKSLVENNSLPHCVLYKAGHHGSKTSSSKELMQAISPEIVCVCCCCGSPEYTKTNENQFPTQDFVDNVAPYTDAVYVTSYCKNYSLNQFTSMNGTIVFACSDNEGELDVQMYFSDNDLKLKQTAWFADNRTCPDKWKDSEQN